MRQNYVISYLGKDKPGLVDQLSQAVSSQGGSWLASRSVNLGGMFGGIIEINLPTEQLPQLEQAMQDVRKQASKLLIEPVGAAADGDSQHYQLKVVGADRPGIVAEVAAILSRLQVNIEEMETEIEPAPMSSDMTFHLDCRISLPADMQIDQVETALEALADDLMVETDR